MKCSSLEEVRANIDQIDDKIIQLITERGGYVRDNIQGYDIWIYKNGIRGIE